MLRLKMWFSAAAHQFLTDRNVKGSEQINLLHFAEREYILTTYLFSPSPSNL